MLAIAAVIGGCAPSAVGSPSSTARPEATPRDTATPSASAETSPDAGPSQLPTGWQRAASMVHPRVEFHSVLLTDGTLLAVGEDACVSAGAAQGSERAEVYNPGTDRWTEVGSLNKPRGVPQLVALPDGTAMVLGGVNEQDVAFSSTKVYSPRDRAWSAGPLMIRADVQAAITTKDGRIIAVGVEGTEILDRGGTAWRRSTPPPKVFVERLFLLPNGVLVAAGENDTEERDAAFLTFDPHGETWTRISAVSSYRFDAVVVALEDGSILSLGQDEGGSRVERLESPTAEWTATAPMHDGRVRAQVAALADGRVLVAGGMSISSRAVDGGYSVTEDGVSDATEIYDPGSDTWTPGPRLGSPRQEGYAKALPDGSVLVYGGYVSVPSSGTPDTGTVACPPPIAETERLYAVP